MIEHQRTKQFARSLLNDFKADTAALNVAFTYGNKKIKANDSLFTQVELPEEKWKEGIKILHNLLQHSTTIHETAMNTRPYFNCNIIVMTW